MKYHYKIPPTVSLVGENSWWSRIGSERLAGREHSLVGENKTELITKLDKLPATRSLLSAPTITTVIIAFMMVTWGIIGDSHVLASRPGSGMEHGLQRRDLVAGHATGRGKDSYEDKLVSSGHGSEQGE